MLADFQRWYDQALAGSIVLPPPPPETVDLASLLGHFVALRQEVNLQTRSVRAQQEQTADYFRRIEDGIDALARRPVPRPEPRPEPSTTEALRPLLKTLVDLYDALALAGQQIQRVQASVLPLLNDLVGPEDSAEPAAAPPPQPRRSFWSRWFLSPSAEDALRASQEQLHAERRSRQDRAQQMRESAQRVQQAIEALLIGYTMSLERLDRALARHDLQPIATLGRPFDPEQMEAVDVAVDTGRPAGEVVEEVRRGYLHNGRVFRYAQVRVARG